METLAPLACAALDPSANKFPTNGANLPTLSVPTIGNTTANTNNHESSPETDCPETPMSKKRALSPSAALCKASDAFAPVAGMAPIDPQALTLLKVIGRGTFAQQVALARVDGGDVVVVKTLDKQRLIARKQVAHTLAEKRVLEATQHPFVVKLLASFQTDTDLNFVLEYCQGGELFFHLQQQQQQKFGEQAAVFYAAEVLSALRALHADGVVYRDLKPENVLLDAQGHVKLADFGFAKQDMADGKRTFSFCGSPEYLSPEMVNKGGHGVETDMWSFGCFIYELLTGAPPFQHSNLRRLFDLIEEGRVWYPPYLSGAAISLLQGLLRVNPRSRLTAQQAMDHAFFQSLDWDELLQRQVTPPIIPACASHECTQNFDDGFTSEPVKSLCVSPKGIDAPDWPKRPRQDSQDVFCGF